MKKIVLLNLFWFNFSLNTTMTNSSNICIILLKFMKSRLFLFVFFAAFFASQSTHAQTISTPKTSAGVTAKVKGPHMTFTKELIDLGKVKHGEKRKFKFEFVNDGTEPLDFEIVSGCSCTTIDWPRNKVKVGEKAYLDVTFDSEEKEQSETVDIDIYLRNIDPKNNRPFFKIVKYKFELIK